ncbi:MAG: carboxypeptidase regulatory-like domain-containing protein [Planctomycetes bacterium]|nr:carboxypeptidase regulatory-like domain-containing protein [Planctomycetota bacterium]
MKTTGPLTIAAIVVMTGLVGVVWFELPKSQRKSSATTLTKHELPPEPPRPTAAERSRAARAARANETAQSTQSVSTPEIVDLRVSTSEDEAPATPTESHETRNNANDETERKPEEHADVEAPTTELREEPQDAPPTTTLALELRDAEGRPVHAPQVVARWRDGEFLREAQGAPVGEGRVEFSQELGDGVVLEARGAGLAPTMFGPLAQETFRGSSLALTLPRGSVLKGTTNARGAASLVAWPAGNQGLAARFELELDADGAFTLDGVWSGPLEVLLLDSEGRTSEVQSLASADARTHFETKPGVSMRGVVLDPSGAALGGVKVDALAAHAGFGVAKLSSTTTDSEGRFTFSQAPADALVQVRAAGLAPCWSSAPSEGELRVRLTPRRALTVVLEGVDEGGEWSLSAWGIEDLAAHSTSNGRFELDALAPGPYSFALRGPDGAARFFNYTLAPGGDRELVLRLR